MAAKVRFMFVSARQEHSDQLTSARGVSWWVTTLYVFFATGTGTPGTFTLTEPRKFQLVK
jgi:hypothetical protein